MDIKRRQFLKLSGGLLITGTVISLFPFSFLGTQQKLPEHALQAFQRLSVILTANTNLSTELAETYFDFLLKHDQRELFIALLHNVEDHANDNELHQYLKMEMKASSETTNLIKKITKLWYMGSFDGKLISASGYQQSLVWRTFGTTPPGVANGTNWNKSPSFT